MRIQMKYLLCILVTTLSYQSSKASNQSSVLHQYNTPKRLKIGYSIGIASMNPQRMEYAKSAGVDYVEVSMGAFLEKSGKFKFTEEEIIMKVKAAKKAADDAGVKIWSIHMPFGKDIDLSLIDEADRRNVVDLHTKMLNYCKILKPEVILFHPSFYLGLNEREQRKIQLIKSAVELNKKVKSINAIMVIENMLGYELKVGADRERPLCRSVEEMTEIMNRLPANIYAAVDMNHIKYPERLIRALGKRLKSVHVADGTGKKENHFFPCSGEGQNNWIEILSALNEVGYTGPFMYESAHKDVKDFLPCYNTLYQNFLNSKAADSILLAKNFPLLQQIKRDGKLQKLMLKSKVFNRIKSAQSKRIENALKDCETVSCYAEAMKWTNSEITELGDEFQKINGRSKVFGSDNEMLTKSWNTTANGINRIFDVYLAGKAPRYVKIDSISFKPGDVEFKKETYELAHNLLKQKGAKDLFFEWPVDAAIGLLRINGRDEAARYEPLNGGLNEKPFLKIKTTNWNAYKYSLILIPGLGPEEPGVALDPKGAKRCEEGAERYRKGLAPFIVVSGGQVHPFKTPFNEAVEMKKYMVGKLGIPEEVIFIEPHARHTTTNLRNTSRMIYNFGMPDDKPVLIVTDKSQSAYIVKRMEKTAIRDLGYIPYTKLTMLNDQETEFHPVKQSLDIDPSDPLDPR